jgi:hypothetical protein
VAFLLSLPLVLFFRYSFLPFQHSIVVVIVVSSIVLLLFPSLLENCRARSPSSCVLICRSSSFDGRLSHPLKLSTYCLVPAIFLTCRHCLFFESFRSPSIFSSLDRASYPSSTKTAPIISAVSKKFRCILLLSCLELSASIHNPRLFE